MKFNKFKKVSDDLNETQVTEKTLTDSLSESKFLCLKHKFQIFSLKINKDCLKTEKKVEKMQKFDNQVSSSSKLVGKFL